MAGTIAPGAMNMSPSLTSSALPGLSLTTDLSKKPSAPRHPRVDVEPLYTSVKSAISDADWAIYKKLLSFFLLGNLNQEELSHTLGRILVTRELEHAHNALVTAIYANTWRDPPEAGIASWVSSGDKPSTTVKGTHDESEKRLKYEVMQLSRRERKRLKTIPAATEGFGSEGWNGGTTQEYVDARRVKEPETGPVATNGAQGGGFGKTNWPLEIRKRYTASLFSETHEFPTPSTITQRLTPTCYEHGLPQGHAPEAAEFLNIATETYIKEALGSLLGKVWVNGKGFIKTGEFKKRLDRESELNAGGLGVGSLVNNAEAEERRKRKMLNMEDMKLALRLGDGYLGQSPIIAASILNSRCLDTQGIEDLYNYEDKGVHANGNGVVGGEVWNVDFTNGDVGDPMQIDGEEGNGWQGGDAHGLDDVLDDVLNLADL